MQSEKVAIRAELSRFLRYKRSQLSPESAGITRLRRRAPGLRLEEVATRAGVGITWYSAFERGETIRVSRKMTVAVARALHLDDVETEFLERLVHHEPVRDEYDAAGTELDHFLEGYTAGPALALNGRWDVLACNSQATRRYGLRAAERSFEDNLLQRMFADPTYRALHENWDDVADHMTATFHLQFARFVHDVRYTELVDALSRFVDFKSRWDRFLLRPIVPMRVVLHDDGALHPYEITKLEGRVRAGGPPVMVIFHTPA